MLMVCIQTYRLLFAMYLTASLVMVGWVVCVREKEKDIENQKGKKGRKKN